MKSLLLVVLITLGLSSTLYAQEHVNRPPKLPPNESAPPNPTDLNTWSKFTSDVGRFSVLMPGVPENKMETTQSEHGPYTTHQFILRRPRNAFVIGFVDYDPSFNFNRRAELDANRDQLLKNLKARLVSNRQLKIDGYDVIEFTAETDLRNFKGRVYMVGRRPYLIVVGSPKNVDDTLAVNRFFNSFKINP